MIISGPHNIAPFPLPDLTWRQVQFAHQPVPVLHWGQGGQQKTAEDCGPDGLHIVLPDSLQAAVPKRQSEFLAGRLCAALALQAIDFPTQVPRLGRAPVWPAGCVGSITHTKSQAIAVASKTYPQLGIDCEDVMSDARAEDISRMIFGPAEAALRPRGQNFGEFTTLIFSAKEAFYKAVSAQVGRVLDFHEVTLLSVDADREHPVLELEFLGHSHLVYWHMGAASQDVPAHCITIYAPKLRADLSDKL